MYMWKVPKVHVVFLITNVSGILMLFWNMHLGVARLPLLPRFAFPPHTKLLCSLWAFELQKPHIDSLEIQLYRTVSSSRTRVAMHLGRVLRQRLRFLVELLLPDGLLN